MLRALFSRVFWFKFFRWEFWPMQVLYIPILFYGAWLSWRARSFTFWATVNPAVAYGGLFADSKYQLLEQVPQAVVPTTLYVPMQYTEQQLAQGMAQKGLAYPLIFKPDFGERGKDVALIHNAQQAQQYRSQSAYPVLVQAYVPKPVEVGLFYYKLPGQPGRISSIVVKQMLSVTGTGQHTVLALMQQSMRTAMHIDMVRQLNPQVLQQVPAKGQTLQLSNIGNHVRGATFLNGNHLITPALTQTWQQIAAQVKGFYYGRFDVRCQSLDDLTTGQNLSVIELNGAKAEPAHIYHPGFSIIKAYQVLFQHWRVVYKIGTHNHQQGWPYPTFWRSFKDLRTYHAGKLPPPYVPAQDLASPT